MRPVLRAHHDLDRGARAGERALHVDGEEPVEVLVLEPEEQAVDRDAGVGDEDVEPAEALARLGDRLLDASAVGDVEADDLGLAAGGSMASATSRAAALVAHVVDDDVRALLGERLAVARPMPREPPVTSATLPVRSNIGAARARRVYHSSASAKSRGKSDAMGGARR